MCVISEDTDSTKNRKKKYEIDENESPQAKKVLSVYYKPYNKLINKFISTEGLRGGCKNISCGRKETIIEKAAK